MTLPLEALTIAALVVAAPGPLAAPAAPPGLGSVARCTFGVVLRPDPSSLQCSAAVGAEPGASTAVPWLAVHRAEIERDRTDRRARIAANLGAALAWDLADLPARRSERRGPIEPMRAGALFHARRATSAEPGEGGALAGLIARWNHLYPPYALEGMNDH